jgi:hypothetical protein
VVHDTVNSGPVSCVYRAYERGTLVATGRLVLDALPEAGDEVMLNGRNHVVRSVEFGSGEHVLELEPSELTPG